MPFDGTNLDAATRLLIEARERVAKGWTQKDFQHRGRVCMLGALGWRNYHRTWFEFYDTVPGGREAAERLGRSMGEKVFEFVEWNDAPGRKKSEVLAVFDRAIAFSLAPAARRP